MKVIVEGHRYKLDNVEGSDPQVIQFIEKQPKEGDISAAPALETVADGTTNEEILEMLIDRMLHLQSRVPCRENAITITKLQEALMWQEKRTADRVKRKVEATEAK